MVISGGMEKASGRNGSNWKPMDHGGEYILDIRKSNKRKKEYLNSYRNILELERELTDEINQLRLEKQSPKSTAFDAMPKSHNTNRDLSDYVARIDDLLMRLQEAVNQRIAIRREINERLNQMAERENLLLYLRYIQGLSFREIAQRMRYEERQIYRIHGDALRHFPLSPTHKSK